MRIGECACLQEAGIAELTEGKLETFPIIEGGRDVRYVREIDSWITHIWLKVIKKEYERSRILEESNVHFSTPIGGESKKNPRVDLAVVILDEGKETPIDMLAVIELKHYEKHEDSIGIQKDLDHLDALRKGVYYPYKPTRKLIASRAYFLYLVDEGNTSFDPTLQRKIELLKKNGYLKVFLAYGNKGEFVTQQ